MTDQTTLAAIQRGLRRWARGVYPMEAAVELLITAFPGAAMECGPWLRHGDEDGYWIDVDEMTDDAVGTYSGGQTRIIAIARSLLNGEPVNLYAAIPGLDDLRLAAVQTAISHAWGHRPESYNYPTKEEPK